MSFNHCTFSETRSTVESCTFPQLQYLCIECPAHSCIECTWSDCSYSRNDLSGVISAITKGQMPQLTHLGLFGGHNYTELAEAITYGKVCNVRSLGIEGQDSEAFYNLLTTIADNKWTALKFLYICELEKVKESDAYKNLVLKCPTLHFSDTKYGFGEYGFAEFDPEDVEESPAKKQKTS
jgi:hypothetical protein